MNPIELHYAATHEWLREDDDGSLTVGITDHAQDLLGDVVFADLPEVGDSFEAGDVCMLLESVKAASDIHMPISGEIIAVNTALEDEPELINQDAFTDGWLFKVQATDPASLNQLMSAEDYEASLDE
jgi:glycine cleavage system H protein